MVFCSFDSSNYGFEGGFEVEVEMNKHEGSKWLRVRDV